MSTSNFKIGFSTNLIDGLNPDWNPSNGVTNILFSTKKQTMQLKDVEPVNHRGEWSLPNITLHETAKSLLDELIPYEVVSPGSDVDAPKICAGALLAGMSENKQSLQKLSQSIGVDLTNENYKYALVKLERLDGADMHPSAQSGILVHARPKAPDASYGLNKEFISDSKKLRHAGKVRMQNFGNSMNVDSATSILNNFANYGTHYLSSVQLGDSILQVFAYSTDKFQKIKSAYESNENYLSGQGSEYFAQFTTDSSTGKYGYVSEYGEVISLSNSDIFKTTMSNGLWKDDLWSNKDSVFSLFNNNSKLSIIELQEKFLQQTVVQVQLASLSLMIEQKRGLLWQRIFKGAMVQKYRTSIEANFAIYDKRDFITMIPEDTTGIISNIATPTINIYKGRIDISKMQFVAQDEVENFILFSNVLSCTSDNQITIPGNKVKLIGQVLDMRTNAQPKSIVLSDEAFNSLELSCSEFLGALIIQNTSDTNYNVIVDGIKFAMKDTNVVVESDVRTVPESDSLEYLKNSFQYSMTFAEAVISDQSSQKSMDINIFIRNYLNWLSLIIPSTTSDEELIAIRVRALDLANYEVDPNQGSFVPILPAKDYSKYISSILDYLDRIQLQIAQNEQKMSNRKLEELTINVGKTLNENIIQSGKLVSGIIDVNVAQQKDMESFYDSIITQKEAEAKQQQLKINELKASLFTAQGDMDLAVQNYQSAVERKQISDAIQFGLDVATNLFNLGISIATPAASISAVKEMNKTVQIIQKTLNIMNATAKLYNGVEKGIKGFIDAQTTLDGLNGAQFGNPSTLGWDEMSIQFNEIMATGADVKEEKAALQKAFSILILRGKAVTSAVSSLHGIERDIFSSRQQKKINSNQAERLSSLENKFEPKNVQDLDKAGIDLMGLSGHLVFIQNQMLNILAKAFLQKDLALQYENLQPATSISSFSILKFSAAIVKQNATTIDAKSKLAQFQETTTSPIDFVVENVKPSELINGAVFNTNIFLDSPKFFPYVDTKVVSVVATINGIESTQSSKYLLKLAYNGSPFHDRDIDRNSLNFRTPTRERIYEYEVDGNKPVFTDGGKSWSDGVSPITPFSTWEISLPNTQTNKDIKFNQDNLSITLTFVLQTRIVDVYKMMQEKMLKRMSMKLGSVPTAMMERSVAPMAKTMLSATAQPFSQPSSTELIKQMYVQGTCTNGWDVVFNMGLTQINSALKDQYETLKKDTTYKNTIKVDTNQKYPGVTVINKFTINYGYPLLTFSVNNTNSATLEMEILSGSVQKCSKIGDNDVICNDPEDISGEKFTAVIDIEKVAGKTKIDGSDHDVLRVELDMAKGAFTVNNFDLDDETKLEFNQALRAYFINNPVIYLINELDLTAVPTLEALKPSNFSFKPYVSQAGIQMLQLYIMTGGRDLLNYSQASLNNIQEPLPDGSTSSLMVRSELIFNNVLPLSLDNGWSIEGLDPKDDKKAWSGIFTNAYIEAEVDLSQLNHTFSSDKGYDSIFTYSIANGNNVNWSLEGTTLVVKEDGQIMYSGNKAQKIEYVEKECIEYWNKRPTKCSSSTLYSDVILDANATLTLSVNGSDRDQTICISTSGKAVNVTGHLSGGGPSGSDDLEAQVNKQIQEQIPSQIANKLSFNFEPISVFALKNLLFPSGNYINFKSSALPGDMLILGDFKSLKE